MRDAARGAPLSRARRLLARGPDRSRTARPRNLVTPVWLVLPDPFSSRLFFDTGIVRGLSDRFGDRLELFLFDVGEQAEAWADRAGEVRVTRPDDLADNRIAG